MYLTNFLLIVSVFVCIVCCVDVEPIVARDASKPFNGLMTREAHLGKSDDRPVIKGFKPKGFRGPSPDENATTVFPMTRSAAPGKTSQHSLRKRWLGLSPTHDEELSQSWSTNVKIGTKTFSLVVDTGSSDTWVAQTGFKCFSISEGTPVNESVCKFGDTYTPSLDFKPIPNVHLNIFYGDGSYLTGTYGKVQVAVGGLSTKQQIAIVDVAGWQAIGKTCGILGLAFPQLTAAFAGTDPSTFNPEDQLPYDPFFTSLWKAGKIPPVFSLAIGRGTRLNRTVRLPDGYLALGGLAPVNTYGAWGRSPIQYVQIGGGYVNGSSPWPQYQYYTITPDEFIFKGSTILDYNATQWSPISNIDSGSKIQVLVDSGTTLVYLPTVMARSIAALFEPPAVWDPIPHAFAVPCDAKAPDFAVMIGGVVFPVDKRDMIVDDATGRGTCISGVNDGKTYAPYAFGDVFLKNVMVVHDIGAGELRFKSRGHY